MKGATAANRTLIQALVIAVTAAGLWACTIKQAVEPLPASAERSLCIIQNDAVRESFLDALDSAIQERGWTTRRLPEGTGLTACDMTATYLARWSWDLALYMSFADIRIYRNGTLAGSALYDSRGGSGNLGKFIDAETKIEELVSTLFP